MAEHVKTRHLKIKDFSCHLCDFSSSAERLLKYHFRQKHNLSSGKGVSVKNVPQEPQIQTAAKVIGRADQCPKCSYINRGKSSQVLVRHMRERHGIPATKSDIEKSDVTSQDANSKPFRQEENQEPECSTPEYFMCNLCSFVSAEKDDLITHANEAHRSSTLDEGEPEPPHDSKSMLGKPKDVNDNKKHGSRQPKSRVPSQTANVKTSSPAPPSTPTPKAIETRLPGGWVKKITPRKSGVSSGQYDAYLFAPDGTKLRQVLLLL